MHSRRTALALALATLLGASAHVAAQRQDRAPDSPPAAPEAPQGPPRSPGFDIPSLRTHPDGVFNRMQTQWNERRDRMRRLRRAVMESGGRVDELRRSNRPEDVEALSAQLAEMHRAVEAMRTEREDVVVFLRDDIHPRLPAIIAEVDDEIESLPEGDRARVPLTRLRGMLERWESEPDTVPGLLADQPAGWGPRGDVGEGLIEGDERAGHWILNRLERLQGQQQRLEHHMNQMSEEIDDLQRMLEALPPEALESLPAEPLEREGWSGRGRGRE